MVIVKKDQHQKFLKVKNEFVMCASMLVWGIALKVFFPFSVKFMKMPTFEGKYHYYYF